jgi:cytochrome c oxidase subunit 2
MRCHTLPTGTPHIGPTWLGMYGSGVVPLSMASKVVADAAYLTGLDDGPLSRVIHRGFLP